MRLSRPVLLASMVALGLAGGGVSAMAAPAAASTYTITDLGSLGYGVSYGFGINANGQVTGRSYLSKTVPTTGCPGGYNTNPCVEHPHHAFLYGNGTMSDLGTLGGINSEGRAINLAGTVAGWANTKSGARDAFVEPNGKRMVDLGALAPLAGWESTATGINDVG